MLDEETTDCLGSGSETTKTIADAAGAYKNDDGTGSQRGAALTVPVVTDF